MASSVSVYKIKTGLYQVICPSPVDSKYQENFSKVVLTSLGVDECYEIQYSMDYFNDFLSLWLTLWTPDQNTDNFKQRKLTVRFLGDENEMSFSTSSATSDSRGIKRQREGCSIQPIGQQVELQEKIIQFYRWAAHWTKIGDRMDRKTVGCSKCKRNLGMGEYFEILIDMDPKNSLEQGQQSVLSNLTHLWESKNFADITFRCEDQDIGAHKCIVSSGSPVLAAMFQSDFKEKQERIVEIKETKADVFEKLLYFLYTGKLDLQFNDMSALYLAADMYNIVPLKKECEKYLSENITVENATTNLILSHLHNAEKLYNATLHYMQKNSEAICSRPDWMTVIKNYPELGFAAMQFMVKKTVDQEIKEKKRVRRPSSASSFDGTCF